MISKVFSNSVCLQTYPSAPVKAKFGGLRPCLNGRGTFSLGSVWMNSLWIWIWRLAPVSRVLGMLRLKWVGFLLINRLFCMGMRRRTGMVMARGPHFWRSIPAHMCCSHISAHASLPEFFHVYVLYGRCWDAFCEQLNTSARAFAVFKG